MSLFVICIKNKSLINIVNFEIIRYILSHFDTMHVLLYIWKLFKTFSLSLCLTKMTIAMDTLLFIFIQIHKYIKRNVLNTFTLKRAQKFNGNRKIPVSKLVPRRIVHTQRSIPPLKNMLFIRDRTVTIAY